jgi:endonuclease/exonuclease/phosphatase family metal-dependent hydrolase
LEGAFLISGLMGTGWRGLMRLLTYNIHRWIGIDGQFDLSRSVALLEASQADILALQEVIHPLPDGRQPLVELAECLGMEWVFGVADAEARWVNERARLGNAILSRYPILASTNHPLPRVRGLTGRAVLGARIRFGEALAITVYCTHLDHVLEPLRWAQLSAVLRLLKHQRSEPHWLMGDFNAPSLSGPRSRALAYPVIHRLRSQGYVDAFAAVGCGRGATFPADIPILRLDYLFVTRYWAHGLLRCWPLGSDLARRASDHRPVVAEWEP